MLKIRDLTPRQALKIQEHGMSHLAPGMATFFNNDAGQALAKKKEMQRLYTFKKPDKAKPKKGKKKKVKLDIISHNEQKLLKVQKMNLMTDLRRGYASQMQLDSVGNMVAKKNLIARYKVNSNPKPVIRPNSANDMNTINTGV